MAKPDRGQLSVTSGTRRKVRGLDRCAATNRAPGSLYPPISPAQGAGAKTGLWWHVPEPFQAFCNLTSHKEANHEKTCSSRCRSDLADCAFGGHECRVPVFSGTSVP